MKRFFIKSIACLSLVILLAGVLPVITSNKASAQTGTFSPATTNIKPVKQATAENKQYDDSANARIQTDAQNALSDLKPTQTPEIKSIQDRVAQDDPTLTQQDFAKLNNYNDKMAVYNNAVTDSVNKTISDKKEEAACGGMILCGLKKFFSNTVLPALMGLIVLIINYIIYFINIVLSFILTLSAGLLDGAINFTLTIGQQGAVIEQVKFSWAILRDTFNIFYIFILLYVAITTILQVAKVETKKMIASVVVSALFINFSLMITNVIIDTGNIFASAIYSKITDGGKASADLSVKIMQGIGLQTTYSSTNQASTAVGASQDKFNGMSAKSVGLLLLQVMQMLMLALTIWAFVQGAVLIVARTVVFFILMATSPIGFVGDVIPKMGEYTKKWWDTLNNQVLVAPVFLFFMLILVKLMTGPFADGLKAALQNFSANAGGSMGGILNLVMIVGFIIAAVKVTKTFSGEVGAMATGIGAKALGLAAGIATGGAAFAGRGLLGKAAATIAESDTVKRLAASNRFVRGIQLGADRTAKASFDIRNTDTFGKLGKKLGVDAGKGGGKDGFVGEQKRYSEEKAKYAKDSLGRNISNEDAIKEHEDLVRGHKVNIRFARMQAQKLTTQLSTATNQKERERIQEEILRQGRVIAQENKKLAVRTSMEDRDPVTGKLKKESIDKISNERKSAYQAKYAKEVEANHTAYGRSYNKKAADKIRKDVVGGKSDEQKLADLVRGMATPAAPAAPAAAPATPPPPPAPCWVAEVLYGVNDQKTHAARLWAATTDNLFTNIYKTHGESWAKIVSNHPWLQPIVKPVWDIMAIKGRKLAKKIEEKRVVLDSRFDYLFNRIK